MLENTGLVLEGGGMRGVYTKGYWNTLWNKIYIFHM